MNDVSIGILMLDTQFPRVIGDVGNEKTWDFPVIYKIVEGANPDLVVRGNAEGLKNKFIKAAKELKDEGAKGITTSCGFLSIFQEEIADAVDIPVMTSALMQVPMVQAILPKNKQVGILTISASTLSEKHLRLARVPVNTPIGTTEGGNTFTPAILGNKKNMNVKKAREENMMAAKKMMVDNENIGAIVLECTNMTPYADDIVNATNVPVFSMVTMVKWFHSALVARHAVSRHAVSRHSMTESKT